MPSGGDRQAGVGGKKTKGGGIWNGCLVANPDPHSIRPERCASYDLNALELLSVLGCRRREKSIIQTAAPSLKVRIPVVVFL